MIKILKLLTTVGYKIIRLLDHYAMKYMPIHFCIHPSSTINTKDIVYKKNCKIRVDCDCQISGPIIFEQENASVSIGKRVFMNGKLIAAKSIDIGDDILIAWGVTVVDHDSHSISFSKRSKDVLNWRTGKKDWKHVKISPVKIADKVWIGFNSIILEGLTIGEGAVVGAGSVVTKDVAPWTVVAGNPARVILEIPENER